jgi:anaerobic selenocysteine-containing dehydrogenase
VTSGSRDGYPLLFVPGRVLLQSQREIQIVTGRANRIERDELVELSSEDAASLNISEGDRVEVRTPQGSFVGTASLKEGAASGLVSSTRLFGQLAEELKAGEEPDPMSGVPGLVIAPARVAKT